MLCHDAFDVIWMFSVERNDCIDDLKYCQSQRSSSDCEYLGIIHLRRIIDHMSIDFMLKSWAYQLSIKWIFDGSQSYFWTDSPVTVFFQSTYKSHTQFKLTILNMTFIVAQCASRCSQYDIDVVLYICKMRVIGNWYLKVVLLHLENT